MIVSYMINKQVFFLIKLEGLRKRNLSMYQSQLSYITTDTDLNISLNCTASIGESCNLELMDGRSIFVEHGDNNVFGLSLERCYVTGITPEFLKTASFNPIIGTSSFMKIFKYTCLKQDINYRL